MIVATRSTLRPLLLRLALALLAFAAGCVAPGELDAGGGPAGEPELPRPWTARFRSQGLVVADRIFIEGPQGLLDHVAARSEDGFHSYEAETLPEGFRQTFRVLRPEAGVELRAYLDAFEVVAFRELVIIERPGELPVRIHASGDAFMHEEGGAEDRRGTQLEIVGVLGPAQEPPPAEGTAGESER